MGGGGGGGRRSRSMSAKHLKQCRQTFELALCQKSKPPDSIKALARSEIVYFWTADLKTGSTHFHIPTFFALNKYYISV